MIGIVGHQLKALGHQATWVQKNDQFVDADSGINVVVEGFTPHSIRVLKEIHEKGGKFLIIATEEPSAKGFNQGTDPEMIKRSRVFKEIAPWIEGILYLVPGEFTHQWYNEVAPAAYAELGHAPSLERRDPNIIPKYDYGFFGSLSGRRHMLLKRLAKQIKTEKAVRVVADFADQTSRDAAMRDAKVIIQVRKFPSMGLVSSSRINTALSIGRPVVAEPHLNAKPWDEIAHFSKSDDTFLDECLYIRAFWQAAWEKQFKAFKTIMTPEKCIGEPLRRIGFDGVKFDRSLASAA